MKNSTVRLYNEVKAKELSEFISFCSEYEKEKFTAKCKQCKHFFINDYDMCFECDCDGEKKLTRSPQAGAMLKNTNNTESNIK